MLPAKGRRWRLFYVRCGQKESKPSKLLVFPAGLYVVLALHEKPVESTADLARLIGSAKPGAAISAALWRDKKLITLRINVEAQR